ncbi:MAG TPA: hypothetical protein DCY18_13265 [Thauera sp.]|nr:hypothetical protein [Thauera sp.]HRJ23713.1 hypothetical protein [Thauera sp.]HRK11832.1 hypothetical protein [Thauera sp.]
MFELLVAAVALVAILTVSCFRGRTKKQSALSRALATPEQVRRLYLRKASEFEAYWLHVEFSDGRKRVLAAPWEVDETLSLLAEKEVRLSEEQLALLATGQGHLGVAAGKVQTDVSFNRHTPVRAPFRAGA